jgi:patatin-like phospholipase/acyl hydrolase
VILKRICRHRPGFLDEVDLICGTSAGGLITLLLGAGYSAEECDEIYSFGAPHIFAPNPWRFINPWKAKYSDKAKQEIFQYYLGERKFGDLVRNTAVVAFRLDGRKSRTHSFFNKEGWRPAVFTNMPRAAGMVEPDLELKVIIL